MRNPKLRATKATNIAVRAVRKLKKKALDMLKPPYVRTPKSPISWGISWGITRGMFMVSIGADELPLPSTPPLSSNLQD